MASSIPQRVRNARERLDLTNCVNAAQWWRHDKSEDRYNYLYSADELETLTETAGAAKSVVNAVMLKAQLGEPIEGEYPPELIERYPDLRDLVATPRPAVRALRWRS
jgi:hypothetical protein